MTVLAAQIVALDQAVEIVAPLLRVQPARQLHRAQYFRRVVIAETAELVAQEAVIETGVVGNEDLAFEAAVQPRCQFLERGRVGHHGVTDAGQRLYCRRNAHLRVHQGTPFAHEVAAVDFHQSDFGDAVEVRRRPRCLQINEYQ